MLEDVFLTPTTNSKHNKVGHKDEVSVSLLHVSSPNWHQQANFDQEEMLNLANIKGPQASTLARPSGICYPLVFPILGTPRAPKLVTVNLHNYHQIAGKLASYPELPLTSVFRLWQYCCGQIFLNIFPPAVKVRQTGYTFLMRPR